MVVSKHPSADAQLDKGVGAVSGDEAAHLGDSRLDLLLFDRKGLQTRPLVGARRLEAALALGDRLQPLRLQLRDAGLVLRLTLAQPLQVRSLRLRALALGQCDLGGVLRFALRLSPLQLLDTSVRRRLLGSRSCNDGVRLLPAPCHLRRAEGCELVARLEEALALLLGLKCRLRDLCRERLRRLFLAQQELLLLHSNLLRPLDRRAEQLQQFARVGVHARRERHRREGRP